MLSPESPLNNNLPVSCLIFLPTTMREEPDVSDDSLRAVHADRTAVIIHSDVEIASGGVGKGDQRFSDRRFVPGFPDSGCECVKFRQDESHAIECLSIDCIDLID